MKENKKYKYQYLALNLRAEVVLRFRKYSKKIASSHSEALSSMLDYFEWHNFSPHQRFAKDLSAGQEINRKRIEALIAITKSIEKTQNIPITNIETMLKSLFQEEYKHQMYETKKVEVSRTKTKKSNEEAPAVSRMRYEKTNRALNETKERLLYILDKVEPVNNRFGKDFLKIEITREELARFKRALKDS